MSMPVYDAMERFIKIVDENVLEEMDFEALEGYPNYTCGIKMERGAKEYMLWAALRPILRSYATLVDQINDIEKAVKETYNIRSKAMEEVIERLKSVEEQVDCIEALIKLRS